MSNLDKTKEWVEEFQHFHGDPEQADDYLDARHMRIASVSIIQFARDMGHITLEDYTELLAHFYPS